MARPRKNAGIEGYRSRVEHSKQWRRSAGYDMLWSRLIDLYRGKHFLGDVSDEDRIAVNISFANVNTIVPSVAVNHPKITVMGTSVDDGDQAIIAEAVTNYQWRRYGFQTEIARAVKDSIIMGHGIVKVGWKYEEREEPLSDEEMEAEFERKRREADAYAVENPDLAAGLPTDDEIRSSLEGSTKRVAVEDRPFVERVSPFDLLMDPEATTFDNVKWIAQRVVRTMQEIQNDPRISERAKSKVEPDSTIASDPNDPRGKNKSNLAMVDPDRVTTWEYYDLQRGIMMILSEAGEEYLLPPTEMPYAFGHPFVFLTNYEVPDHLYPMGDLEAIEPLQHELNKTRSMMMNARKHYGRKYLYDERAFGPEGRRALASNKDGAMVPVIDSTRPLDEVIRPFPFVPLSPEVYSYSEQVTGDINAISGVNDYARGNAPEIRRTATEASIIQDAANGRAADKLARVERFVAQVARKVVQLNQQYMTGELAARVMGPQGEAWFTYTAEDISGEFDFEVEAGSTQPMNESTRRQQTIAMLNAMAPFIGTVVDPMAMAQHALKYGFGIKNPERFLVNQTVIPPTPMGPGAQQQQEPTGMDTSGQQDAQGNAIPPAVMAQLQGQVGLDVGSMAGQAV